MSRLDVIDALHAMDAKDRAIISAYLRVMDLSEDPEFAQESSRRLAAMRRGERIDSSSLREIHRSLEEKGI